MRERNPNVQCRRGEADEALLTLVRLLARHAAREDYDIAVDASPSKPIGTAARPNSAVQEPRDG